MPVNIFDIPKVAHLVLPEASESGAIRMNYPVNRTDFTVLRGMAQTLTIFVRGIDRQIVDLTDQTLSIIIAEPNSDTLLLQRDLIVQDAAQGTFVLNLLPTDTLAWPLDPLRYTVLVTRSDGSVTVLWTDRDYTPFGIIRMQQNPLPGPAPAITLTPLTFTITDQWATSSALPASRFAGGAQTFAFATTDYTGTVRIQATLQSQPNGDAVSWFNVASHAFDRATGTHSITTTGMYTFMRVQVVVPEAQLPFMPILATPIPVNGRVDKITVRC